MDGLNARVCWPIRGIYFPILIMETLQNFWKWPSPFKSNFDSASIVSSIDWFELTLPTSPALLGFTRHKLISLDPNPWLLVAPGEASARPETRPCARRSHCAGFSTPMWYASVRLGWANCGDALSVMSKIVKDGPLMFSILAWVSSCQWDCISQFPNYPSQFLEEVTWK